MRRYPVNGEPVISQKYYRTKYRSHLGEDLAVHHRTAIIAPTEGKAIRVRGDIVENWLANTENDPYKPFGFPIVQRNLKTEDYGNYVKLDHGSGITTLYAHLDEVCVVKGQVVKEGELIAYSDNTGNSTGNHLHWEIRRNDFVIDPGEFDYSFNGKGGEDESKEFFPYVGAVTVRPEVDILYVRSGPHRGHSLSGYGGAGKGKLIGGDEVRVSGFVKGERIEYKDINTQFWWVSTKGNYFWSGGTDLIPTLDNYPEGIVSREKQNKIMEEKLQLIADLEAREDELEEFFEVKVTKKEQELRDVQAEIARLREEVVAAKEAEPTPEEAVEEAVEEKEVETVDTVVADEEEKDEVAVEESPQPEEEEDEEGENLVEEQVKSMRRKFEEFLASLK